MSGPGSLGERRVVWLALIVLAVLGTIAAGITLSRNRKVERQFAQVPIRPESADLPDPTTPGGPVSSRLSIARSGPGEQGAGKAGPPIVRMGPASYHESSPNRVDESVLAHEIIRQAVLCTARDAGSVIRDSTLGDAMSNAGETANIEVSSFFALGQVPFAVLARQEGGERKVLASFVLGRPMGPYIDYAALIEQVEVLSRSPDGLLKVLRLAGLAVVSRGPRTDGDPDPEVERRLGRLTFTEQFAAVRLLNAEIREHGESPARLGALARGYANLSVLAEFHWGSRSKALKARALIAAQRLVARDPGSAHARWHRAYARALSGFQKDALDDLAAARLLMDREPEAGPPPAWAPMVEHLCRFRTTPLLKARQGPHGGLAMFLAFLTVEDSRAGVVRALGLGRELLVENPECFRVHDKLCEVGGAGSFRTTTLAGLRAMDDTIPRRLKQLPGLPGKARAELDAGGPEASVVKSLVGAGESPDDLGDPSWASLGRMVADTRFALVYRRADFLKHVLEGPVDGFLKDAWPTVADHPHRSALAAFRLDPRRDHEDYNHLMEKVTIPDIGYNEYPFIYQVGLGDLVRHVHLLSMMLSHGDSSYRDLVGLLTHLRPDAMAVAARDMGRNCPHSPLWKARLIQDDWGYAGPYSREWEAGAGEHPDVLSALGSRFLHLERWDDAVRCLKRATELSPDISSFRLLAQAYRGRGDRESWEKTLHAALETEDIGLGHMVVQIELADDMMGRGEWAKALPLAEAAASGGARDGLLCLARCREGMGDWGGAEACRRRSTQQHPSEGWMDWFLFCKRTGHGDVDGAKRFAEDYVALSGDRPAEELLETVGYLHIVDGKAREAVDILRPLYLKTVAPSTGIILAALLDGLDEPAERDRILGELSRSPQTRVEKLDGLLNVLRRSFSAKVPGPFDPAALADALGQIPASRRHAVSVFTASILHNHGEAERAKILLRRGLTVMPDDSWERALATIWLDAWEHEAGAAGPPPTE